MKTTNTLYVMMHIGRGGQFHNPGHVSFIGEGDFQDLLSRDDDKIVIVDEDEEGNPLPDDEWYIDPKNGEKIAKGRDAIEAETGRLEFDYDYNTDYVVNVYDLEPTDKEFECLWNEYINHTYMSDELKDALCTVNGMKRAHKVVHYPSNFQIFTQDGADDIAIETGECTREEWREDLEQRGFCPLSVEMILDAMERYEVF